MCQVYLLSVFINWGEDGLMTRWFVSIATEITSYKPFSNVDCCNICPVRRLGLFALDGYEATN